MSCQIKKYITSNLNWILTIGWLVFGLYLWFFSGIPRPENLNGVGDFIAGMFAPLAFFWLVRGYYQQNKTIKANSSLLSEQIDELKLSKKLMVETNQPSFSFLNILIQYYHEHDLVNVSFKMKNDGQKCKFKNLDFLKDTNKITCIGESLRTIEQGHTLDLRLSIQRPSSFLPPEVMFAVIYQDIFGQEQNLFYVLNFSQSNSSVYIADEFRISKQVII